MSARSRFLLERDVAQEETALGKAAAEAGDYLAKEKTVSSLAGAAGAYGGIWAMGLMASGPLGWGAAAIGAGLGYIAGAKLGEEGYEAYKGVDVDGWWGEDKYSDRTSEFYTEDMSGKFLQDARTQTADDIMEAKKGTDVWGGIGKGALMSAVTAGVKYGAIKDLKSKVKAGKFAKLLPEGKEHGIDKAVDDAIKLDLNIEEYLPEKVDFPKVIAGKVGGEKTMLAEVGTTKEFTSGKDFVKGLGEKYTGASTKGKIPTSLDHPDSMGRWRVTDGSRTNTPSLTATPDWLTEDFAMNQEFNIAAEAERVQKLNIDPSTYDQRQALASRGTERVGKNLEQVLIGEDRPSEFQGWKDFWNKEDFTGKPSIRDYENKSMLQVLEERNIDYKPTKLFDDLEGGFAGDIPKELAYSPEQLENIKSYGKPDYDWKAETVDLEKDILAEKKRLAKGFPEPGSYAEKGAFGMKDFTEESWQMDSPIDVESADYTQIDYDKGFGRDWVKSRDMVDAEKFTDNDWKFLKKGANQVKDVSVTAVTKPGAFKELTLADFQRLNMSPAEQAAYFSELKKHKMGQ